MSGYCIGKDEAILVRKKEFEQLTARVKELEKSKAVSINSGQTKLDQALRIATLEQELNDANILAIHIHNWCNAIEKRGTGWDDWDEYYKDAHTREDERVYKLVKKYISQAIAERDGGGV